VGLTFHHGSASYAVPAPPADFVDATLGSTYMDAYLLDLHAPSPDPVREWLSRPAKTRLVGPAYNSAEQFAADEARKSIPVYEELQDEVSAQLNRDVLEVIGVAVR
jgi:hypothetical protein